ncbi:aldose 1-epimerase family protein [Cellulomonas aerilata]|uniref:aldose 1-epimerase family protein n=1 Tax=Cellulomonas aerilata TaxID=515326 RepID=UPI0011BEC28D|nr:aldose 1-epimerase family protein [Cellulomonas aerilata]
MTTTVPSKAAPTGVQYRIRHDDHAATVTEVGATLREYAVGGRDVVHPFPEDALPPAGNGAVLVPWPNRLRDGRYTYEGVDYQLPINEPDRMTSLHGLGNWQRWTATEHTHTSVTLELALVPTPGYPFPVRLTITYALSDDGLRVDLVATNEGDRTAPYGTGFHPWLSPNGADLDDCTLRLDAATKVTVDDRLLPTGTEPAARKFDFRTPSTLRDVALDDAYVDVVRDEQGLAWIQLAAPDGRTAAVWMDGSMDTFQVCTGDELIPVANRTGVAAEPMSCIADAFRTGERLVHLAPGQSHTVTWGATLL